MEAAVHVLPNKWRTRLLIVILNTLGCFIWGYLFCLVLNSGVPFQSVAHIGGAITLATLFLGQMSLVVLGMGLLWDITHNKTVLLECWRNDKRIQEDHNAWQRYLQLSSVDKLGIKAG